MGDRANVVVKDEQGSEVFLYTHWGGQDLPEAVKVSLERRQRWDDPAYLARIVFCEMVKGCEKKETGFGISTRACDNDGYPYIVLDVKTQEVRFEHADTREVVWRHTFEEFALDPSVDWPVRS